MRQKTGSVWPAGGHGEGEAQLDPSARDRTVAGDPCTQHPACASSAQAQLAEPPYADPHVRWGERATAPPIPIVFACSERSQLSHCPKTSGTTVPGSSSGGLHFLIVSRALRTDLEADSQTFRSVGSAGLLAIRLFALNCVQAGSRIGLWRRRASFMPHYEFFCRTSNRPFSKTLTPTEYKGKVVCPRCGSEEVDHRWVLPRHGQGECVRTRELHIDRRSVIFSAGIVSQRTVWHGGQAADEWIQGARGTTAKGSA